MSDRGFYWLGWVILAFNIICVVTLPVLAVFQTSFGITFIYILVAMLNFVTGVRLFRSLREFKLWI